MPPRGPSRRRPSAATTSAAPTSASAASPWKGRRSVDPVTANRAAYRYGATRRLAIDRVDVQRPAIVDADGLRGDGGLVGIEQLVDETRYPEHADQGENAKGEGGA